MALQSKQFALKCTNKTNSKYWSEIWGKNVNLTLPIGIEEIENIRETYPEYPYRQAFTPSNLRLARRTLRQLR